MSLSRITPAALVLAGATLAAMPAFAQPGTAFPAKPVRIIVPFAPGGQSDIISRVVGQKLSEQWGQPMVYENRGGAGGTLGIDAMLRSPADGYAIGAGSQSALSIAQHLYAKLPYDPLKEVQGVVTLVLTPYAVAVNARVPAKNIDDLVRLSRAKPVSRAIWLSASGEAAPAAGSCGRSRTSCTRWPRPRSPATIEATVVATPFTSGG